MKRKVRSNGRSLIGEFSSKKNGKLIPFESDLESRFLFILENDSQVISFESQDVQVNFCDGKKRVYTPDIYVKYACGKEVLFEVKTRYYLKKTWDEFRPKYVAAINSGRDNGYIFKIITDAEIRSVIVNNLNFLIPYKDYPSSDLDKDFILNIYNKISEPTPFTILNHIPELSQKGTYTSILWSLIANGKIGFNFSEELSNNTLLSNSCSINHYLKYPYRLCRSL
ncbi:MAG: heteromeric transposase endonuclease subunit TnsA [Chitinophagaceae bacterium]|nr:heteromeric transposase endonuclease subunit TnsA [Chitinophagaceae bacterium]